VPDRNPSRMIAMLLLLTALCTTCAFAADLSTRDVVAMLYTAAPGSSPDLAGKDLTRLDLAGVDFKGARLRRANLFGADLSGSNLAKADLAGANLDRATITGTSFAGADLAGASLQRPNVFSTLEGVAGEAPDFSNANLAGAQLSGQLALTARPTCPALASVLPIRAARS
jgi:uncharacterized protein YjbI with pentapeptide repeats